MLNIDQQEQAWEAFGKEEFDVCIIGGGSVGAGAALDAATRGLKVALIEARDFASGTSSRSSKMFHGGLRYLAMLDFRLVAESLHERELSMTHLAPHLVKPLRFIFPLTHRVWERPYMAAGFFLYDVMGGSKSVPMQKHLTRRGTRRLAPGLREDACVGGIRYFDTLVDDARHTLTVIRTAAHYGATVRPATQVIGFTKADGKSERVTGVQVRDTDTGRTTEIRAKAIINATGIWTNKIEEMAGLQGKFTVRTSKGVHLMIPRRLLPGDAAMTFVTEKSVLFVIPWDEFWIVGTTDTDYTNDLAHPVATEEDIQYILDHLNAKVARTIHREDVVATYAGLRPLVSGKSDSTTNLSRNHAVARLAPGFYSVAGGKYTTYRVIGKDVVDALAPDLPAPLKPSVTETVPLLGADGYQAILNCSNKLAEKYGLPVTIIEHMINRYGDRVEEVLAPAADNPHLLETLPGTEKYIFAEVLYAVTHEGARHLDDVLSRRIRLSMELKDHGEAIAREVVAVIAPALRWDEATADKELAIFSERLSAILRAEEVQSESRAEEIIGAAPEAYSNIDRSQDGVQPRGLGAHDE